MCFDLSFLTQGFSPVLSKEQPCFFHFPDNFLAVFVWFLANGFLVTLCRTPGAGESGIPTGML
jgi:hypothetical protein